MPAAAARCSAATLPTTFVRGVPTSEKKAAKIRIASRKLAAGPARTTRNRCHTGRTWKARDRAVRRESSSRSAGSLAGRHVADEFHIAAKRQPADLPPRALPVGPADDLAAEADREGLRRDAEQPRDQIMAKLVEEDERAERANEGHQHEPQGWIGQHRQGQLAVIMASARSRVTRSISRTSLIERGAS